MTAGPRTEGRRISVIVVSYNTSDLLRRCIESLGDADQIIVVDNASHDDSAEMVADLFPHVVLVRNQVNRGFGAACNQGLNLATGDFWLLLNSDAFARPGALRLLANALWADDKLVAVGGRLEFPDGRVQSSCCNSLTLWVVLCEQFWLEKAFPMSPLFSPYWLTPRMPLEGVHRVAQVMGACLGVRPGPERFDERFFLYCEDTELCLRLSRRGSIAYVPEAIFEHELGASSSANRWQAIARYNRGKELYFRLHGGLLASFICLKINRIGAFARLLVYGVPAALTLGLVPRFRNHAEMWWRVLSAPLAGPALPPDARR
ncbi:MAG: glycosyltransferase family 2 protein [Fimbriimonadaceae bacterium]|nr:glycosyltransferase family 2 protein [Fimbriimonadaceae bacterium]